MKPISLFGMGGEITPSTQVVSECLLANQSLVKGFIKEVYNNVVFLIDDTDNLDVILEDENLFKNIKVFTYGSLIKVMAEFVDDSNSIVICLTRKETDYQFVKIKIIVAGKEINLVDWELTVINDMFINPLDIVNKIAKGQK